MITSYFFHRIRIVLPLALMAFMAVSCVENDIVDPTQGRTIINGLGILPHLDDIVTGTAQKVTRADDPNFYDNNTYSVGDEVEGDDVLKENDLGTTLDVFIAGQGSDPFWYQFHLIQGQDNINAGMNARVLDNVADLLTKDWTELEDANHNKLVKTHKYDVYVAVNNTATNANIASKADLLDLQYASLTQSGGIKNVWMIYGAETNGAYDASRRMLMSGHKEWTCGNAADQVIEVPLRRAEAKIVADISISPAFWAQTIAETGIAEPIYSPMWKYVNFSFDTNVFAEGTPFTTELQSNSGLSGVTKTTTLDGPQTYYYYNGPEIDEEGHRSENTLTVYFDSDDTDEYDRLYKDLYFDDVNNLLADDEVAEERTVNNVPRYYIVTYTYTDDWEGNAQERAPYILVSFGFKSLEEDVEQTSYNYFRIPVCDESAIAASAAGGLERNHIYKVNAIISGKGSTSLTTEEKPVDLTYSVLPWTQDPDEQVNVVAKKFHYFFVNPSTYTLRGNNDQSVSLDYYAAVGDVVKFRNLKVYYYNSSGSQVSIYTSTSTENTNGMTVKDQSGLSNGKGYSISVNTADQTIDIVSSALDNRAVKYISFTAYLTFTDENNVQQTLSQDIVIKHYPLDNIQSIEGAWSSRWDGVPTNVTYYTYNVTKYYRKRFKRSIDEWIPIERSAWATGVGTNNVNRKNAGSSDAGVLGTDGSYYRASGNDGSVDRTSTRSNSTPSADNPTITWNNGVSITDGTRTFSISNRNSRDYDYVSTYITNDYAYNNTNFRGTATLVKYNTYERLETTIQTSYNPTGEGWVFDDWEECSEDVYNATSEEYRTSGPETVTTDYLPAGVTDYTSETVTGTPSTGTWVDWSTDQGSNATPRKTVADGMNNSTTNFQAKVYDPNGPSTYPIYTIVYNNSGVVSRGQNLNRFNNNHMYVIQISSTSSQYVIGKPVIDNNYMSQDNVVYPSLMIASQLGGLTSSSNITAAWAAQHCGTYMEVDVNGKRFTGWRLPTDAEISIIGDYQYDANASEIIAEVLSANTYRNLSGGTTRVSSGTTEGYVRCVREMSEEDLRYLEDEMTPEEKAAYILR